MRVDTMKLHSLCIAVTAVASSLAACYRPSMLYDESNPAIVEGCPDPTSTDDLVARSYAAMLKALSENKWRFDHLLPQQGTLVATACITSGPECVTMVFSVDKDGGISVTRSPNQEVYNVMDGHMFRWMRNFEQQFSLYRCMSTDLAIPELEKFGAIQDAAPPAAPAPAGIDAPVTP